MAFGLLGILISLLGTVVALTVLYYVIRFAVRDGVVDANRLVDAQRTRAGLGVGVERSDSSR